MKRLIQLEPVTSSVLITFALLCVGFLRMAQAVVPPPDGGYPGFNTAEGQKALFSLTTGVANTGVGWFSLWSNTDGSYNTAVGAGTLLFNVGDQAAFEGVQNTAVGAAALLFNTTGSNNTATGALALVGNTTGGGNTATGHAALRFNTTGTGNTAVGGQALTSNTTGSGNTASGGGALGSNTTGANSTAIGSGALLDNTVGNSNTAIGYFALDSNTTGGNNVAVGNSTLPGIATGVGNIAVGYQAGSQLDNGNNNIYIGTPGVNEESDTIRIGNTFAPGVHSKTVVAGIYTATIASGLPVYVAPDGQLAATASSRRVKEEIRPMERASEVIYRLEPVTFRYIKGIAPLGPMQFGLVAEDVDKVQPNLVVRDKQGKPYGVRYDQVNAMLLNEFLKEHRKVEKLEALVTQQRKDFEAALTDLTGQIQRVSAQLELSKPAPQTVKNTD
jgi:hypothetical protein